MSLTKLPHRILHIDFHTMPGIRDVGSEFDAETFAGTLEVAGVQCVTVFAKCNLGCAYYPTDVGMTHPSLKFDMLGQMVEACHRRDIKVIAYFNAGIDQEQALRHRDWCKLNAHGQVYALPDTIWSFRRMCLETGYGPHLLAMIEEVLTRYPVDGIFLDCFQTAACYGVECVRGMKAEGTDIRDEAHVRAYVHRTLLTYCDRVRELVARVRPGIQMFFNCMEYRMQPTHLEIEVLPQGGWGYDYLPWTVRYVRTLGKPYLVMTGRFQGTWGEMCGIRPEAALFFDCYNALANAAVCSVGDHLHPRGAPDPDVYALIGKVFATTKRLEPWTEGATALAEIAVMEPAIKRFPAFDFDPSSIAGAARMLMEAKYQFDVVDDDSDLSKYRVVILPDHVTVDDALARKLQAHLRKGGAIISSAFAGTTPDRSRFVLDEYQIEYGGRSSRNRTFVEPMPEIAQDIPSRMPTTIYETGVDIKPREGVSTSLARLIDPYVNFNEWDWEHVTMYVPPDKLSEFSALVRAGNVFHFSFPLFKGYFDRAIIEYRHLLRNCIRLAMPDPMIKTHGLPSFAQVTLTRQRNRTIVHILTYVPEIRGKNNAAIEEPITVRDIGISLRLDNRSFAKAYFAPDQQPLDVRVVDGYAHVRVPEVTGYQMIVFEE